jgi:hypothetical protein
MTKLRIRDLVHGMVPEDPDPNEPEIELIELDIDVHTIRSMTVMGTTKRLYLWTGNEAALELAEAVLPKHTLKWYREQMELIDLALGNFDQKRDVLLIQAIQRGFAKSEEDKDADEERVGRII